MDRRVVGVDVARFVALAGMMAIHILPAFEAGEVTFSQSLAGGRASALFAVLAGVSVSLASRGRRVDPWEWDAVAAGLLVRAALIGLLGLWLGGLDTRIAVILAYYGLLFLVGIPFVLMSTRALFVSAAVWSVVGPVLSHAARPALPEPTGASPSLESLNQPLTLIAELTFTGFYPVFVWVTYLLVGMGVGRLVLRDWRVIGALGLAGAALVAAAYTLSDWLLGRDGVRDQLASSAGGTVASLEVELSGSLGGTTPTDTWWWLAVRSAHSGTPLDLMQTTGSALAVLAVCLVVGRVLPRSSRVVFGAGAMTLTLYTAHVLARQRGYWDAETTEVYVGQLVVAAAVGALFGLLRMRGPLEWVVGRLSRLARREPLRAGSG